MTRAPTQRSATSRPAPAGRECRAHREIGHTEISRSLAVLLVLVCGATMLSEPLLSHVSAVHRYLGGARTSPIPAAYRVASIPQAGLDGAMKAEAVGLARLLAGNRQMQQSIATFETGLDDEAVLGRLIRPRLQAALSIGLGAGNEQVYCGEDGWLFFRPSLDHLVNGGFLDSDALERRQWQRSDWERPPEADPRPAILDLHSYLEDRGIKLILLPVPVKASIHPERMTRRLAAADSPLHNPSFEPLLSELKTSGVNIFDPSDLMLERARSGEAQFLRTDTHWSPAAMKGVAEALAAFISSEVTLPPTWSAGAMTETVRVTNRGDLAAMLELPGPPIAGQSTIGDTDETAASGPGTETVEITRVMTADDSRWQVDPGADVLLLGDSFTNVFSLEAMGWGEGAGLAEHLALSLGRPIDAIVRNDDAAHATRELLARELARGRDRLADKKVVVWELTARELSTGDWREVPMRLSSTTSGGFFVPADDETWIAQATIAAIGPIPRPRSAPYPDYIVALHLVDLELELQAPVGKAGPSLRRRPIPDDPPTEALVFVLAMEGSAWLPPAHYRIGQNVRLRLQSWSVKEAELGLINRGEIYADELIFQEPCWGEEL